MLHSLDHVVIATRDLTAATETYTRLLGRQPSWRGAHPALGTENSLFRLANTYLELLTPVGAHGFAGPLRTRLESAGEGLLALAFGTDDAEACAKSLRERGIAAADPVSGEGRESSTGAERRWRNVLLPESQTRGVRLFAIEHLSPAEALPVGSPLEEGESAVAGLDHVVIRSPDPEATRALYGDQLGIRLALDRSFEARGVRLLFFRIGGITVEIAARLDATPERERPDELWGLAYWVPDVAAGRARAAAAGLDISEVRPGNKPGTRVCTVRGETHGVATLFIGPG